MPVYFSNPDLLWANEFPVPRLGQGAFAACLEMLHEQVRPLLTAYASTQASQYSGATWQRNMLREQAAGVGSDGHAPRPEHRQRIMLTSS